MHPQALEPMTTIHQRDLRQQAEHDRRAREAKSMPSRRTASVLLQWIQMMLTALR